MSSLKFGTSGLRGLVTDLVGEPSFRWSAAFCRHLGRPATVFVGRDLRSSSPRIVADCMAAVRASGAEPVDCGALPTPALALAAMTAGAPAIMVTGSHIPDDRNGLKFYRPDGEITKADETGILDRFAEFEADSSTAGDPEPRSLDALSAYRARYVDFFGADALSGLKIGVYQHSSVARDVMVDLVRALGGEAVALGRSDRFVPVDTEAHRPEDVEAISGWAADGMFDAIVSTDGDADRPLVADEMGRLLRGDVIGLLTARHLGIETIVTPVTSSAAVDTSGIASNVVRTKVGSPFVIAGMEEARAKGASSIIGFEANGGLLLGSPIEREGRRLDALQTRDAMLPILAALAESRARAVSLGGLVAALNAGHAAAHRLQEVAADRSRPFLERLATDAAWRETFFAPVGIVVDAGAVDGVRVTLADGSTVHFRASGNAPELRCYVEAASEKRARELLDWGLAAAERTVR